VEIQHSLSSHIFSSRPARRAESSTACSSTPAGRSYARLSGGIYEETFSSAGMQDPFQKLIRELTNYLQELPAGR
jgi:hypothetical protein